MAVFKCDSAGNSLVGKWDILVAFLDSNTSSSTFAGEEHDTAIWAIGAIDSTGAISGFVGNVRRQGSITSIVDVFGFVNALINHALHLLEEELLLINLVGLGEGYLGWYR